MKKTTHKRYFEEYLEVCKSVAPNSNFFARVNYLKGEQYFNSFSSPVGVGSVDYTMRKYLYICDHMGDVIGYPKEQYVNGGLDFHMGVWHPEDKRVFEEQVFCDIITFWKDIPPREIPDYRFSYSHRYFRNDGSLSQILQHSTYMEPQANVPLINLFVVSDIGDFKGDNNIVLTISKLVKGLGYVKVFSKTYKPKGKLVLSSRELEILRLTAEGLSSKMIADKLYISEHTVKNHKANMMEKTFTNNIAGLVNLSVKNNWL